MLHVMNNVGERLQRSYPGSGIRSGEQLKTAKIVFGSARLQLDHAAQGAGTKRVRAMMKRQSHATAIRMAKATMTAPLSFEDKTVSQQRAVEFAGGQRPQPRVVNVHAQTAITG